MPPSHRNIELDVTLVKTALVLTIASGVGAEQPLVGHEFT